MSDNTTLDAGSGGDTIATDDISGVKFPRSKIVIGADGTNDGDVSSANPLPVTGTITANLGVTDNAVLDAIAAFLAGTLTVDLGANNDVTVTGTVDLGATDNAVLDAIAASLAGTLTVGSHAVTNAGTFAVQVDSCALPTGAATAANQGTIATNTGNAATALQVIDDWDEADRAKVNPIVGQAGIAAGAGAVGATVPRVTLASDDPAVALLGTMDTDTGNIATSVAAINTNTALSGYKRASGLAASGTVAMVSAVAAKKIRIHALALFATSTTVTNVYVANDDNDILGDATNPISLSKTASGDDIAGFVLPWNPGGWCETDTANEALNVILSAAQDVIYALTYSEVD